MRRTLAMLSVAVLVLAACGSDTLSTSGSEGVLGQWQLESGTIDDDPFPFAEGARVTFTLDDDGTFGGTAACNSYGGEYDLDGSTLVLGEWAMTAMACADPAAMVSEQAFTTALRRPVELTRNGEALLMKGDGVDFRFAAVPAVAPAVLTGTTWQLHTLLDGETAASFMGDATLRLDEDGTFQGSTGCREVTGTYVLNGDEIGITSMSADGECPPELADQDSFVVSVLESPRVEMDGDQLRLWTSGNEGLQYRAETAE